MDLLLAQVNAQSIEIHGWCLMDTHFHFLLRSPRGAMSNAFRIGESRYVLAFNSDRERDGPLVRGRFYSKPADCDIYRPVIVRYLDENPVLAGITSLAGDYPHSTAHAYRTGKKPAWHTGTWIEEQLEIVRKPGMSDWDAYRVAFDLAGPLDAVEIVDRRLRNRRPSRDELSQLVRGGDETIAKCLVERGLVADGMPPPAPVVGLKIVHRVIGELARSEQPPPIATGRSSLTAWTILTVGLMRTLACATRNEVAILLGITPDAARHAAARHQNAMLSSPPYLDCATQATKAILSSLRSKFAARRP